jgi:hypothetical protein
VPKELPEITTTVPGYIPQAGPRAVPGMATPPPAQLAIMGDRRGVAIPVLPGRSGEPTPYSDKDAARYEYVQQRAQRDENGDLTGKYKRSWKDVGLGMLVGFLQGAGSNPRDPLGGGIGGAAAGGLVTGVNPMVGREYAFDSIHAPGFDQQEAQQRQRDAEVQAAIEHARKGRLTDAETRKMDAEARSHQAQAILTQRKATAPDTLSQGEAQFDPITHKKLAENPKPEPPVPVHVVGNKVVDNNGRVVYDGGDKAITPEEARRRADDATEAEYDLNQIIEDSVRGDPGGIARYMSPAHLAIVQNGGKTGRMVPEYVNGKPTGRMVPEMADDAEIQKAQDAYVKAQHALRAEKEAGAKRNLERAKALRRMGLRPDSGSPASSRGTNYSIAPRNVIELRKKYLSGN